MNADRRNVSPHFTNYEYACTCSNPECFFGGGDMHPRILSGNEKLRALACEYAGEDVPLRIISGGRCGPHNKKVEGHPNSQHMRGAAADVQSRNPKVSAAMLAVLAFKVPEFANGGIGINEGGIHVDVGHKTTWFYTEKAEKAYLKEMGLDKPIVLPAAEEVAETSGGPERGGIPPEGADPVSRGSAPPADEKPAPAPKKTARKSAGRRRR